MAEKGIKVEDAAAGEVELTAEDLDIMQKAIAKCKLVGLEQNFIASLN